jgi:hypothetical protein
MPGHLHAMREAISMQQRQSEGGFVACKATMCQCRASSRSPACNQHTISMQSTYHQHAINIPSACNQHTISMQSTYHQHAINVPCANAERRVRPQLEHTALEQRARELLEGARHVHPWHVVQHPNAADELDRGKARRREREHVRDAEAHAARGLFGPSRMQLVVGEREGERRQVDGCDGHVVVPEEGGHQTPSEAHQKLISANHRNGRDGHVLVREQRLCDLVARATARNEHAMLVRVLAMRPAKVTKLTT